jgi:hypothetical protein
MSTMLRNIQEPRLLPAINPVPVLKMVYQNRSSDLA